MQLTLITTTNKTIFHIYRDRLTRKLRVALTLPQHSSYTYAYAYAYFTSKGPIHNGDHYIYKGHLFKWMQPHTIRNIPDLARVEFSNDPQLNNAPKFPILEYTLLSEGGFKNLEELEKMEFMSL